MTKLTKRCELFNRAHCSRMPSGIRRLPFSRGSRPYFMFVLIAFLCTSASGCTSPSSSPSASFVTTGVLDWEYAIITLPIESYGMSLQEQQIVEAAQSLVFARCVMNGGDVGDKALSEAKRAITILSPNAVHWLYGAWDAPVIAAYGMSPGSGGPPSPAYMQADPDVAYRCTSAKETMALEPIFAGLSSMNESVQKLTNWYGDSITSTSADERYMKLLTQLGDCLSRKGYSQNDFSDGGFVHIPSAWDSEQVLKANLAEAQCEDDMGMTQQAADISAEYQMQYIKDNQAELLEIKRISNERVEKAKQVLHDYGILS